jgi:hypothetical protein
MRVGYLRRQHDQEVARISKRDGADAAQLFWMSSQNRIVSALADLIAVGLILIGAITHERMIYDVGFAFAAIGLGAISMSGIYRRRWQLARRVYYEASKSN